MSATQDELYLSNYHAETNCGILDGIADEVGRTIPAPSEKLRVVVTVPANNEARSIASCLKSLALQYAMADIDIEHELYEVLVLCHNCTDSTVAICRRFQTDHPAFKLYFIELDRGEVNNVGAVRRVLMRIAALRLPLDLGYIATTDADTLADRYWIANLLGYTGSEYGMVCGRIDVDFGTITGNARKTLEQKQRYFELRTKLEHWVSPDLSDPWPRHAHQSGPNLAVRRDVYLEIGGISPKGFLEDIALYDSVCIAGHNIRHCPHTLVTTSCRLTPRTPWGFGSELKDWSQSGQVFFEVEGLERLLVKFRVFEMIRFHYRNPSKKTTGAILKVTGLEPEWILECFDRFESARPMINTIDRGLDGLESWQIRYPLKIVSNAMKELEDYLEHVLSTLSHI